MSGKFAETLMSEREKKMDDIANEIINCCLDLHFGDIDDRPDIRERIVKVLLKSDLK